MNPNFFWIKNKTGESVGVTPAGWFVVMESVDRGFYWMHNGTFGGFHLTEEDAKNNAEKNYHDSLP